MDEISYSGSASPRRRFSRRALLFGILALVILLLLGGLVFFVTRKGTTSTESTTITLPPTNEPVAQESPTPSEDLSATPPSGTKAPTKAPTGTSTSSKSDISVVIQNGSGEAGVAAKASDALKSAGYTIASTGNADNFDYTGVTVQVKSTQKSILAELKSDLIDAGYEVTSATADLSAGQSYDALVIIGK